MDPRTPALAMEHEVSPFWRRVLAILWPSFLIAGVQVALVFVVVDPATLHWFGAEPIEWPAQAVYTVSFLIFWFTTSLACGLCELLRAPGGP